MSVFSSLGFRLWKLEKLRSPAAYGEGELCLTQWTDVEAGDGVAPRAGVHCVARVQRGRLLK